MDPTDLSRGGDSYIGKLRYQCSSRKAREGGARKSSEISEYLLHQVHQQASLCLESDRTKLSQGIEHRPSMSDRSNQDADADAGTVEKLLWPTGRSQGTGLQRSPEEVRSH